MEVNMPSIGCVTKRDDGSYDGYLATLSIRENIAFVLNRKTKDCQPDFFIMVGDIEVGTAWYKRDETSGTDYLSVLLTAPEFGNQVIHATLVCATESSYKNEFKIVWNPDS